MLVEDRKEGFRPPGVGVAGICEPLTWVLETDRGNSRMFSYQLNGCSSPEFLFLRILTVPLPSRTHPVNLRRAKPPSPTLLDLGDRLRLGSHRRMWDGDGSADTCSGNPPLRREVIP